ncbi:MltD2 [Desulfamplus magnetovallimortis]|uniref:MltD2 n=1 Tax=Desulfamplus magnetovallimortis TaxID=1246637 RepID=A0A1W1H5Y7_9BACT|nr:LysM peptidoglycan-binding domain-containing protein [Desulfamplus magnetovallimortis]SLM27795.1 MltD2 [Desulfamplus magnetovallimortis]
MMTIRTMFIIISTFIIAANFLTGCASTKKESHLNALAQPEKTDNRHFTLKHFPENQQALEHDNESNSGAYSTPYSSKQNNTAKTSNNSATSKRNFSSEEIDHALELCESAQLLWEKGELDKALNELDAAYSSILELDGNVDTELNQQKEDLRFMISKRILEIYASRHIVVKGKHNAIPVTLNKYVKKEIERLTGSEKDFFIRALKRSGRYRPYISAELKKAGLPEELSWLPLIESGFRVEALSPARALGLWQFIPSTGYKFGLQRNYFIDERLDPIKSTHAAISYMSELHKIFGDWSTVLAAYNCGEGRVLRTIRSQQINYLDNFWDLYKKLPSETARYVPRFLATLHIINNAEKYDINIDDIATPYKFETADISKQIGLKDIASAISVPFSTLKSLNPELKYALLPPEPYTIKVPEGKKDILLASIDNLNPSATATSSSSSSSPKQYTYHRIRRGETLSIIAKRYGTSVSKIAMTNHISTKSILKVGKTLKIPSSATKKKNRSRTTANANNSRIKNQKTIKYTVKSGDNLWIIAQKYNTTTKAIQAKNNLSNHDLNIGQALLIPQGETSSCPPRKIKKSTYWVKSGDSPFTIAQKYNMTLQRLLALNHLTKSSKIYPGQRLLVE